ncbi:helix-turn-helix domain-containing protein [Sphingomonas sp. MG17]|uniref:Helix-turn-helix domain-containing protein n=1 Tax=Sphingomonas tagetis TaxID=2949092 RepID=A0A9X2HU56_9SPHN|nr:S24 family peptidase [Sphingomonas tagetis]MCP3732045.1 helix-turn-helix domain-containing protein [Sphingomonas tagetis]
MAHRSMASDALDTLRTRLAQAMNQRNVTAKSLAKSAGLGETVVRDITRGLTQDVKLGTIEKLAAELRIPLASLLPGSGSIVHSDQPTTLTADGGEGVPVMRMDLSYAMGDGTNIDESYIEGEPVVFDLGFLRRLTPSSPNLLRVVNGIGDSMQGTINDNEELILDLGQRVLNMQDRIWAISLFGVGAVKRLQVVGKEKILVISDNPDVPNVEVTTDDLAIVGRIVGSFRRH